MVSFCSVISFPFPVFFCLEGASGERAGDCFLSLDLSFAVEHAYGGLGLGLLLLNLHESGDSEEAAVSELVVHVVELVGDHLDQVLLLVLGLDLGQLGGGNVMMVRAVIGLLLMRHLVIRCAVVGRPLHPKQPLLHALVALTNSHLKWVVPQAVVVELIVVEQTNLGQVSLLVLPHFVLAPKLVAIVSDTRVGERLSALLDLKVEGEALVRLLVQRVGRRPTRNGKYLTLSSHVSRISS